MYVCIVCIMLKENTKVIHGVNERMKYIVILIEGCMLYDVLGKLKQPKQNKNHMTQASTYIIDRLAAMVVGMLRMASTILSSSAASMIDELSSMSSM